MVQHRIPYHLDSTFSAFGQESVQLFSAAPLRAPGAMSVELSKIPEIVDVVTIALRIVALAAWGKPETFHAQLAEGREEARQTGVVGGGRMRLVGCGWIRLGVPFEALKE